MSNHIAKIEIAFSSIALLLALFLFLDDSVVPEISWAVAFLVFSGVTLSILIRPDWPRLLPKLHRAQILFLITLMAIFPRYEFLDDGIWFWLTFLGLLGIREGIRIVIELSAVVSLRVQNLDNIRFPGISTGKIRLLHVSLFLATASFAIVLFMELPAPFSLVALALALPFTVIVIADTLRYLLPKRLILKHLSEALDAHQPVFYLYWSAPQNSSYQISMWMPYLKRLNLPFIIIVRNAESFDEAVIAADGVPVILARSNRMLERCIVPSLQAAFYVNNSDKNSQSVRFTRINHIQLLHGDSEKASSYNPVVNIFDRIYVAGQAAIDRYANHGVVVDQEKFRIVGRPQVESVLQNNEAFNAANSNTVLYAPTWAGFFGDSSYSSLTTIIPVIHNLLDRGYNIIFRPHPFTYRSQELSRAAEQIRDILAEDQKQSSRNHLFGEVAEKEMTLTDCFNASDAMIADISSVVSDYLFSGKPLALIAGQSSPSELIEELPIARCCYILSLQSSEWEQVLNHMFLEDPLKDSRHKMRSHYLGEIAPERYVDVFLETALQDILGYSGQTQQFTKLGDSTDQGG